MPKKTDSDLTPAEIAQLTTGDALAAFLTRLGYDTDARAVLTPEAIGLSATAAGAVRQIELLAKDSEGFLRVIFVCPAKLANPVAACQRPHPVHGEENSTHKGVAGQRRGPKEVIGG